MFVISLILICTCASFAEAPAGYSVERLTQREGVTEYRALYAGFHFLTIMDHEGAFVCRPHPGVDPNGWGSSWYPQPFLSGALLRGSKNFAVTANDKGILVKCDGIVCRKKDASAGTWRFSMSFTFDKEKKTIAGVGDFGITLDKTLTRELGDLSLGKIASNYLKDVPLLPTGKGDTGDMSEVEVTTAKTHYTWKPAETPSFFPQDCTDSLIMDVKGRKNIIDTAALKQPRIEPACKPSLKISLTSTTPGIPMIFGAFFNTNQAAEFWSDNIGITPLVLSRATMREFQFNLAFTSSAIADDGAK